MTSLYEAYLNGGAGIEEFLRSGLLGADYAGVKCMDGDTMAGVLSARPGVYFTCGHEDLVARIESRYRNKCLYTCDMIVVLPEYRGRGIARRLAMGLHDDLVRRNADVLIMEEWHRVMEDDVPVSGVLKYMGAYEVIGNFPDFYVELDSYGLTCPECKGVCHCGAIVCAITL